MTTLREVDTMPVPSEVAARRLVGDTPTWQDLLAYHAGDDRLVRQAAIDAAARASDLPDDVRRVLVEVCLDHTGRATSWTQRFHRLRATGNTTRYAADVLQQASTNPVPHLLDLLLRSDVGDLAQACLSHQSAAVRAVARTIAGVTDPSDGPFASASSTGAVRTW